MSLFNLVEQINVPPGSPPPPGGVVPLEAHAYWRMPPADLGNNFEIRFVVVSVHTGLETSSNVFTHRAVTERFRTRTMGLPCPPVPGVYELRVDWRMEGTEAWNREAAAWPVTLAEVEPQPRVLN
jgi:hypothetical protein